MPEAAVTPSAGSPPGGLWRHQDFVLLWGGQTVSETGSAVTQIALPLVAVVALKATTFEVGLLTAASTLAFALIALPAGAIVDRQAKRDVMIGCDVARLVVIGSVPVAWAAGVLTLAQLYVVALAAGVFTVFFDVSYQSYLPSLLAREQLADANGKLGATQSLAQLVGPGLAGVLVGAFGAAGSMAADAASYAVSVTSLLAIRTREQPLPGARTGPATRSLRSEIAEGLKFVIGHPILRKVVACTGTANLFSSVSTAVEIIFLIRVLHVRPAYTGLIFALAAIGGILGGVLAGRLARWIGSARVIWFSILVLSAPQVLPALAEPGWSVALYPIGFMFMFFAAVVYNVAQVSYRQAVTPPQLMGRMNAAVRWIVWGTMPLGAVIGGALGSAIGIRPTLLIGFIGSWAAGLWVYFSPLRRVRDIPREAGSSASAASMLRSGRCGNRPEKPPSGWAAGAAAAISEETPGMSIRGEVVTEALEYDGGRKVTAYVPPEPPEAVVFAGDGQLISRWGGVLEAAGLPPTMIVAAHRPADETLRLHEYSPGFAPERFTAHERFFVEGVHRWARTRFGVALPAGRTAVLGVSAGGELALALGLRHPHVYGAIFCASPGGGYRPPGVMPGPVPRAYLVAGTREPFFLQNAARWADALRDAGADVVMSQRPGSHGDAFWQEELPLMVAWAFGQ